MDGWMEFFQMGKIWWLQHNAVGILFSAGTRNLVRTDGKINGTKCVVNSG